MPYNFSNKIKISDTTTKTLYVGRQASVSVKIKVGMRSNSTVGTTYATKVTNAKLKLQMQDGDNWVDIDDSLQKNQTFNQINYPYTSESWEENIESGSLYFTVPDKEVGENVFCVRAAIFPASSVNNKQMNDNWDSVSGAKWAYSQEKVCFNIAKNPSIQVWGGGMYTNGNIDVPFSIKKNE